MFRHSRILVGPGGVVAVETKTRRKRRSADGRDDYRVIFDGDQLHFPHGADRHGLEQASRNAAWLSRLLSEATAQKTDVQAMLTLPGWFVERRGKGDVSVVSPKEIRGVVTGKSVLISKAQLQRLSSVLDQRCRDLEF